MKSSKKAISVFAYRNLYAPDFAVRQLIEEVLRDVPTADVIEVTAVDLFPEVPGQAALFPEETVRSSVCESPLQDGEDEEAHPLKKAA